MEGNFVSHGKIMIYGYLPKEMLPESFEDLSFDEFFSLYAEAEYTRELKIQDIEEGVAKGIADNFGNG